MVKTNVMSDELNELLDTALYREIASEAFYTASQKTTSDSGAIALMKELAAEEKLHLRRLKILKTKGLNKSGFRVKDLHDLRLSDYLTGGVTIEGAGLQDTLIFAIKKEREAIDFYTNMMGVFREPAVKGLCLRLARAELAHKFELETLYDSLFYTEN